MAEPFDWSACDDAARATIRDAVSQVTRIRIARFHTVVKVGVAAVADTLLRMNAGDSAHQATLSGGLHTLVIVCTAAMLTCLLVEALNERRAEAALRGAGVTTDQLKVLCRQHAAAAVK